MRTSLGARARGEESLSILAPAWHMDRGSGGLEWGSPPAWLPGLLPRSKHPGGGG
jgi:hypothetical protein